MYYFFVPENNYDDFFSTVKITGPSQTIFIKIPFL